LSNNEYFLLSFKDFQTLEWIRKIIRHNIAPGQKKWRDTFYQGWKKDYKVERNGFFSQNTIEVLPVKRVLLSEISNSFLVLTPQWVYDGFVVEWPWKEFYETTQEGEAYWIKRNKEEEKDFLKLLEGLHPNFVKQLNGYYYVSFADAQKKQWFLKTYHFLLEQNIQVVGMDMLQHFRYSKHKAVTKLNITENNDNTLTLKLSLSFDDEEVPLQELQKMLLAGQKAILLKDGSLGVLGDDWMRQYGTILKHGKVSKKEVTVARWMAITEDVQQEEPAILKPVMKKDWWQRWDKWQQPDSVIYIVPAEVKASLRPYQHKGFEWLVLLAEAGAGACLADDMGLGKTLQAICFIAYRAHLFSLVKNISWFALPAYCTTGCRNLKSLHLI
jgi:hypothetical protein